MARVARFLSLVIAGSASVASAQELNRDGFTFRQIVFSALLENQMDGPRDAEFSQDGEHVYVASELTGGITHFVRDSASGRLSFSSFSPARRDMMSPWYRPRDIVVSPDDRFVFAIVSGITDDLGIARFDRDPANGNLTAAEFLLNGEDPFMDGLTSLVSFANAPDGAFLYLLASANNSPAVLESVITLMIDSNTGAVTPARRIDRVPAIENPNSFDACSQIVIAPDGQNLYVAGAAQEGVATYDVNPEDGTVAFRSFLQTRLDRQYAYINAIAMSQDGRHVYAVDSTYSLLITLVRDGAGDLSVPDPSPENPYVSNVFRIRRFIVAPVGLRAYSLQRSPPPLVSTLTAWSRDPISGILTALESITDGVSGAFVIVGDDAPTVSPDSANIYLPAKDSHSLAVFSVERPEEPCSVFPVINEEYAALRDAYNLGDDVDEDQLPEVAALALLAQASCSETNDLLDELITNAYMINLAGTESEQEVYDTGVWIPYQRALATLRILTSAMGEKLNKAFMEYGVQMHDFYVTVWCFSSGYCEPSNAQAASQPGVPVFGLDPGSSDKSLDATPRGFSELFSGAGDPDGDEVTNAQEWANVVARGGTVEEFALAALDPTDDGTLPVVVGGDGNCFIATAAYGTPLAAELSTLREFRDTRLLTNSLGRAFVDTYYRLSPPAADFIATHPAYRAAARNVIGLIIAAPIPLLLGAPALAAIRSFGSRRNKKSRSAVHLR